MPEENQSEEQSQKQDSPVKDSFLEDLGWTLKESVKPSTKDDPPPWEKKEE